MTTIAKLALSLITVCLTAGAFPSMASGQLISRIAAWSSMTQVRSIADRRTADNLLKRARQAVADGNVELAEWYVTRAEQLEVSYDSVFQRFVDTPEKVRESIELLRKNGSLPTTPPVPAAPATPDPKQVADHAGKAAEEAAKTEAMEYLHNGRLALAEGDVSEAISWYQSAIAANATFAPDEYSPTALAESLKQYGVGDDQLAISRPTTNVVASTASPPSAADAPLASGGLVDPALQPSPRRARIDTSGGGVNSNKLLEQGREIKNAAPAMDPNVGRLHAETLRLLSEAQLALDRGDLRSAETLAKSAQNLRVPDQAYRAGEPRPWMLLMEISRRQERMASYGRTELATTIAPPPSAATHPAAHANAGNPSAVIPGGYDPLVDETRVALASANLPAAVPQANAVAQAQFGGYTAPPIESLPSHGGSQFPPNAPALSAAVPPIASGPVMIQNQTTDEFPGVATQATTTAVPPAPDLTRPAGSPNQSPGANPLPDLPPAEAARPAARPAAVPLSEYSMPALAPPKSSSVPPAQLTPPTTSAAQLPVPQPLSVDATQEFDPDLEELDSLSESIPPAPVKPPLAEEDNSPPLQAPPTAGESQPPVNRGEQLFNDGEAALTDHDVDEARKYFLKAWKYERELPPDVRQRLQDHLQALRPGTVPLVSAAPAAPAEPAPLPPVDQTKVQELISEMTRQQAAINAVRESDPMAAWEKIKMLRRTVAEADIDDSIRDRLLVRVDRASTEMENFIQTNRSRIENDQRNKRLIAEIDRVREERVRNQERLADFVEQFNTLLDQQRFPEASVVAKQAAEIAPRDPVVQTMLFKSQVARQIGQQISRNQRFNSNANSMLDGVLDSSVPMDGDIEFPSAPEWEAITRRRSGSGNDREKKYTAAELEIHNALRQPVEVDFDNLPLASVLEQLSEVTGVNMFIDPEGLRAEAVTSETTVSIRLRKPVKLKSALNLILSPLHLSYVVQNEVLRITSEHVRDGDVETRTYNVADLVIPIPNFVPGNNMGLPAALREAMSLVNSQGGAGGYNQSPLTLSDNSQTSTSQSVLAQMGYGAGGPQPMGYGPSGSPGGGSQADFQTLMELITTTVAPESWEEIGGTGTIAPFPNNLSLVIAQTQEVHERVSDLLAQLRRLQDLQVTIEVRFITLNDDFFERIGVDFDFNIDDNTGLTPNEVVNLDDDGPSVTIGLDPTTMQPTANLDVGFNQGSFGITRPTFGGFDPASAATVGFAILSDIEAFFIIEAAQGDSRTNVLQAPKVTLFNGQSAFVSDSSQRPFVTSIIPVVGDFAAAHQPVITVLTEGTTLSVQAVVSQDRRFVRLTLVPFFSQINDVDTFTFDGATTSDTGTNVIDPTDETNTVTNNARETTAGTTVQLPTLAFTTVTTTVSVPDGGTILLGGIKRLSEQRIEQGVPMLSKLPYINRLFKNIGIGRETQSLMMMVTPRIIIQEEEEARLGLTLP